MRRKVHETFWWPGLNVQVQELVCQCVGCQFSGKSMPPMDIPKISIPRPAKTWVKVGLDILGPVVDALMHQKYTVTLVNYASHFPECLLTADIWSGRITKWPETVFAQFGNPDELVSDNGAQFISSKFSNFLKQHGITHTHSVVYNPTENGPVEVFNCVLKYRVQGFRFDKVSWVEGILELLKSYHATPARPGSKSPAELFFGRAFHLDFEPAQLAASVLRTMESIRPGDVPMGWALLKHGPFAIGNLVLIHQPQTLKGCSPFAGPF